MNGAIIRRAVVAGCILALTLVLTPAPAHAQSGSIKGKVTDAQDQPVEGATVSLLSTDKGGKPMQVKTNKKGEYMQVGLSPGHYKIAVTKGDLTVNKEADVHLDMLNFDVKLVAGGGAATGSKEDVAKAKARAEALTKSFADGVALSKDGKTDEAIAKFQEVATTLPNCAECYINIGTVQTNAKRFDDAEASFKKAIEMKPDSADAYDGLANLYNAEKKFPEAEAAGKKAMELSAAAAGGAAGGGGAASASALYNQAVILWNQNKAQDAADKLDAAIKADPSFPEAHYLMGKALINLGKLPESAKELQEYLRLAPNGPNKDDANKTLEMLKPYIK